jgi:hypothetical protein
MEIGLIMLARLDLEKRIDAKQGDSCAHVLEPFLTRCWGCYTELRTRQEVQAGYLCKQCQRRKQWERN